MRFLKYLSDLWKDTQPELPDKFKGDKQRMKRALARERFVVPDECDFAYLYAHRDAPNVGELINVALEKIEDANKTKLENVFRNVDFNSEPAQGQTKERIRRLKHLLEDFNDSRLDLRPSASGGRQSHVSSRDVIGDVYEYLIGQFAAGAGKKAGEFYTPPEVSTLLAKLVQPKAGDRICDPACGSGPLLIRVAEEVKERGHDSESRATSLDSPTPVPPTSLDSPSRVPGTPSTNFSLCGQDSNGSTWALCRMNMLLHEQDAARVVSCATITNSKLVEDDSLRKFKVVVANPPFSLDKWRADFAGHDPHKRFRRGIPPKTKGDDAFITHMVEIALPDDGRVGVIVPHGVLFRGGSEGLIRQKLIEDYLLEAVVGLPTILFFATGIPAAILIFNKGRRHVARLSESRNSKLDSESRATDVLLIDASRAFADDKKQNRLRPENIEKLRGTYQQFKSVPKYAHRSTRKEIEENDFTMNFPRYVNTSNAEAEIDIAALHTEIDGLEAELAKTRNVMKRCLVELRTEGVS